MENLCFVMMVVIVLLPHLTLSASSTYSRPEKFYVNCGSDSNVTYGGRTFVGDIFSGGYSVKSGSHTAPGIYRTVRIFRRSSSYKFQLDSVGLHFLRLHFSALSFRTELLTARFTVSSTCGSGSGHHLKSFSLHNFNETPLVEEFLLMMDSLEFEVRFVPHDRSSVAFVNAIEVFSAPSDLTIPSVSDKNLYTVYRLNVGGEKVTPENDTLGRTWSLDDEFLRKKDYARNIQSIQEKSNYESGSATKFTAPHFIYQTAKTLNRDADRVTNIMVNVTWSFKVKSNSRHFIRIHLCDVLNKSQNPFYLYVNGHWQILVKLRDEHRWLSPFYIDVVNVSDGSGLLNVSLGTMEPDKEAGFLNGLEVMEFLKTSGSDSSDGIYIIAGCVALALFLVLGLLFLLFLKRKKKNNSEVEVTVWSPLPLYREAVSSSDIRFFYPENNSPSPLGNNLQLGLKIPFTDILRATNNFDEQWLIGKGGFGDVYKAILPDGSKVAIKRGKTGSGSGQGILEFQTEIQVLSKIWHRNLVSLTGYCKEKSELILVYEFMEKGTLREHLYGGSDLPWLTWIQRLEICVGAARGLHYLHNGSERAIIHRDVKSTNILLDDNTMAKVADFGISKLVVRDENEINISTNIKGTFGYLDPEYVLTRVLTDKSDVYAFGVVLLEVLCARPALDQSLPDEEMNLADWAMSCISKGTIDEIVDPRLRGQIEPNCLRKFMEIAKKCVRDYGHARPSMADLMWDLDYVLKLQMMTTHREPHEDSAATISGDGSLVIPRLMLTHSFSSNSTKDQVPNRYTST